MSYSDRNIEHLRFLSNFYTNLIETRQIQLSIAEKKQNAEEAKNLRDKICELYENWLRELFDCPAEEFDDVERTMHSMMTADAFWFLAKLDKPAFNKHVSNFSRACESLEQIFKIMHESSFDDSNPFYQHVLQKYEQLVRDYQVWLKKCSSTNFDVYKCEEAVQKLKKLTEKPERIEVKMEKPKKKSKIGISREIFEITRIMLNTIV